VDDTYVLKRIKGHVTRDVNTTYICEWLHFRQATEEPAWHLQPHQIAAYEASRAAGSSAGPNFVAHIDRVVADNPHLPGDVITSTALQFARLVKESKCCDLKIHQRGEPPGGYHRRMAGVLAYACEGVIPLFYMWMVNSESITQVMYGIFHIMKKCPEYAGQVEGFAMDVACQVQRHAEAKVRSLPDGLEAKELYKRFLTWKLFVDKFHFRDHSPRDEKCQRDNNPAHYPELTGQSTTDTGACEQLFRWLSRFKVMMNSMGIAKATLFLAAMMWSHGERAIEEACMDTKKMNDTLLCEIRAAYDVKPYGRTGREARAELRDILLKGDRKCSRARLNSYRVAEAVNKQKSKGKRKA
jgi:hypothetical protein